LKVIIRTGINRLHKSEWLDNFSKARQQILTEKNILAGWRGAVYFHLIANEFFVRLILNVQL
jgi:hypothetical protein